MLSLSRDLVAELLVNAPRWSWWEPALTFLHLLLLRLAALVLAADVVV